MVVTDVSGQPIGQTVEEEGFILEFYVDLCFKHTSLVVSHTVN